MRRRLRMLVDVIWFGFIVARYQALRGTHIFRHSRFVIDVVRTYEMHIRTAACSQEVSFRSNMVHAKLHRTTT